MERHKIYGIASQSKGRKLCENRLELSLGRNGA